jgi:hypothetical protein|tara:strand:+ start:876 stop:1271 length:396 start_codon:yes stop_codon:yes gene_type:complete
MKFIDGNETFPLHVGDVTREIPGWVEGDPLPEGWSQVTETVSPPEEVTSQETLNPEPVDGFIPEGCEGIRESITLTQHSPRAIYDSDKSEWVEEWEPVTTPYDEPYPVVAVKKNGEWLTPAQYMATFNEDS